MLFKTVTLVFQSGTGFDGNKLFNLRRLQAKTKVQADMSDEVLYVDDLDKNASPAKMHRAMDQVSQSCYNYNLTISTNTKDRGCTPTRTMNQPSL